MNKHFVIIGGDAAGMSAASKARRTNPDLIIDVFEKGNWASYGACGLPYYLKGDIKELRDLIAKTPEEFMQKNIHLHLKHEVTRIHPEGKYVIIKNHSGKIKVSFDSLLISTGARAGRPNIEGIDSLGVFTLHDMDSAREIQNYLKEYSPKSAVVLGGGYIGIEMLEALFSRGIEMHLVELLPHILSPFGIDISRQVEEYLKQYADLHLEQSVHSINRLDKGKLSVKLNNGTIVTEMVLVAAGIIPEVSLAEEAGIQCGLTRAIATDELGRTNFPFIYAAGDCAEVKNMVTGKPDYVPLALAANRHGRSIGRTVGGQPTLLAPVAGTALLKVFQLEVARTGITDPEVARKHKFNPIKVTVDSHSRASYYPASKPIKISLLADRGSSRILGASMVGEEGVSKRIDIISAALSGSYTVDQLESLDLAYAPPFGPAWDPVLTAARVLNQKLSFL